MLMLIPFCLTLVLPVLIGVYTYSDAKRRDMNAAVWTLIVILAPALIGFIVYLLVRGSYSDLKCPRCGMQVRPHYVVCPKCGTRLRPVCPGCGAAVEREWKVCPSCACPLPEEYEDVYEPERHRDRAIGKILLAVVLISVLLVLTAVWGFAVHEGGGWSTAAGVPVDELCTSRNGDEIKAWIESIDEDEKTVSALEYSFKDENGDREYRYVIYSPYFGEDAMESIDYGAGGLFTDDLIVEFSDGGHTGSMAYCLRACYEKRMKLRIYVGGVEKKVDVTKVDFDPTEDIAERYF